MEFDCYGEHDGTVLLAEINAHHGALKAAQKNKVLRDIFKMYAQSAEQFERAGVTKVRMVIVFTNAEAGKFLDGRSWAAEAARKFGVESVVVPLKPAQIKALQKTQKDQVINKLQNICILVFLLLIDFQNSGNLRKN